MLSVSHFSGVFMATPAALLTVSGRVHAVIPRTVDPVQGRPAEYDDQGRVTRPAVEARAGYDVVDVTVLTEAGGRLGGYLAVALLPDALAALGGEVPSPGDTVSFAVRPYTRWTDGRWDSEQGRYVGRRPYAAFSVAGEESAALKSKPAGVRAAS